MESDTFWRQKLGAPESEYEDAWAGPTSADGVVRAAVSDGATESVHAGLWARMLADAFVSIGPKAWEPPFVISLGKDWAAEARSGGDASAWYLQAKLSQGAFAAVLGLEMSPDGLWRAFAVGDCCLFHLPENRSTMSWPHSRAQDLTGRPHLLSSRSDDSVTPLAHYEGRWTPGDIFLLATDALAYHILSAGVEGVVDARGRLLDPTEREGVPLRNDDLTLLLIRLSTHA